MNKEQLFALETYNPDHLLDVAIEKLGCKNDAGLSRAIDVAPPIISKIRHRWLGIGNDMLVRLHDATKLPIDDLRALAGIPRKHP